MLEGVLRRRERRFIEGELRRCRVSRNDLRLEPVSPADGVTGVAVSLLGDELEGGQEHRGAQPRRSYRFDGFDSFDGFGGHIVF